MTSATSITAFLTESATEASSDIQALIADAQDRAKADILAAAGYRVDLAAALTLHAAATLHYLQNPGAALTDAIHDCYSARATKVIAEVAGHIPAVPKLIVTQKHVKCPHCGARNQITDVSRAERWNDGEVTVTKGVITAVTWRHGDEGDGETVRYQCTACTGEVAVDLGSAEETWR